MEFDGSYGEEFDGSYGEEFDGEVEMDGYPAEDNEGGTQGMNNEDNVDELGAAPLSTLVEEMPDDESDPEFEELGAGAGAGAQGKTEDDAKQRYEPHTSAPKSDIKPKPKKKKTVAFEEEDECEGMEPENGVSFGAVYKESGLKALQLAPFERKSGATKDTYLESLIISIAKKHGKTDAGAQHQPLFSAKCCLKPKDVDLNSINKVELYHLRANSENDPCLVSKRPKGPMKMGADTYQLFNCGGPMELSAADIELKNMTDRDGEFWSRLNRSHYAFGVADGVIKKTFICLRIDRKNVKFLLVSDQANVNYKLVESIMLWNEANAAQYPPTKMLNPTTFYDRIKASGWASYTDEETGKVVMAPYIHSKYLNTVMKRVEAAKKTGAKRVRSKSPTKPSTKARRVTPESAKPKPKPKPKPVKKAEHGKKRSASPNGVKPPKKKKKTASAIKVASVADVSGFKSTSHDPVEVYLAQILKTPDVGTSKANAVVKKMVNAKARLADHIWDNPDDVADVTLYQRIKASLSNGFVKHGMQAGSVDIGMLMFYLTLSKSNPGHSLLWQIEAIEALRKAKEPDSDEFDF